MTITMPSPSLSRGCQPPCLPRWATPRSGRDSYGLRVAEISGELGTPFMPWQRDTAGVAMEIDRATGLLAYRTVIITVRRRSGKTKQERAVAVHRALGFGGDQRINYTAQSRIKARQKWEDDHVRTLERSSFRSLFRVRKTLGMEAIIWANGSQHGIESTTEKSGHGDTLDLGFIDEAFAQRDSRIEQAFKPAMMTRPQPQLWVVSGAGAGRGGGGRRGTGRVAWGAGCSQDRRSAAIGVCGQRADGLMHVEVADYRPGTSWAAPRLIELAARHGVSAVVVDAGSHEAS